MAVLEGGTSASVADVGVAAALALHVTSKPLPTTLGHYRFAGTTGTMAAALAAAAQVFYVKWADATRFMVIHSFKARWQTLTPFTAATLTDFGFDLFKATNASAGGGGTDLTSAKTKMRTTHTASLLDGVAGAMRISGTGLLTALTTLDAYPIAQSLGDTQRVNPAAATEEALTSVPLLEYVPDMASGEYPLVLANGEALVLRNRTVWPAAGTGLIQVEMAWSEVTAF